MTILRVGKNNHRGIKGFWAIIHVAKQALYGSFEPRPKRKSPHEIEHTQQQTVIASSLKFLKHHRKSFQQPSYESAYYCQTV